MKELSAAEHLKTAKRLHFQGHNDDAVQEYLLVLEIEPENEDAMDGLRALGVEPPDPVARKAAYESAGGAVKTSFFVNQAKESEIPAWRTGPFKLIIALMACLAAYGIYQGVMMFINFDNIKAADAVDAHISKIKTKEDGDTIVQVEVSNFNPAPIKNVVISYQMLDAKGNTLKDSEIVLKNSIPAGDARIFADIDLGALKGKPDKVTQKVKSLIYGPKPKISQKVIDKFVVASQKEDKESFSDWDEVTQDADSFAPALVHMGRAYAARNDFKRAIEQYKKALENDPDDANAHYYMAVALFYNNNKDQAKKEIDKASQLAPDDPMIEYSKKYLFTQKETKVKESKGKSAKP